MNILYKLAFPIYDAIQKRRLRARAMRTTEIEFDGIKLDVSEVPITLREFLIRGRYENAERALCRKFLVPEDRVLELGAAIGAVGILCRKEIGIKQYTGVEANPATVRILEKNCRLNGLEPAIIHAAVGASDGTAEFTINTEFFSTDSLHPQRFTSTSKRITVPSLTFPTLLRQCPFVPNVLIVDIEGAEQFIDFRALPPSIDKVLLEIHPRNIGWPATWNIVGALIASGFKAVAQEHESILLLKEKT